MRQIVKRSDQLSAADLLLPRSFEILGKPNVSRSSFLGPWALIYTS
jgi:hypothetical protein